MQINLIIFGRLTDITGKNAMTLSGIPDTNALVKQLHELYPVLAYNKYVIAVDRKVIIGNTSLNENSTVALMPPFSGG
jgi:molybdopterin synthase sulfur carrier subunit